MFAFCTKRIVIGAIVIAVNSSLASTHFVTRHGYVAMTAFDKAAEQPVPRLGSTRAPFGVLTTDALSRLKNVLGYDDGNGDGDPLLTRTVDLRIAFFGLSSNLSG